MWERQVVERSRVCLRLNLLPRAVDAAIVQVLWYITLYTLTLTVRHSPGRTDVTNCVTTLLFWLFRWHSLISLPTGRGRCPYVKFCESYPKSWPKLSNLHEITQFFLDIFLMLTCLHFWSVSIQEKWCCIWPNIANWKCSLYKSNANENSRVLLLFHSSAVAGVSAVTEWPPTARIG